MAEYKGINFHTVSIYVGVILLFSVSLFLFLFFIIIEFFNSFNRTNLNECQESFNHILLSSYVILEENSFTINLQLKIYLNFNR